MMKLSHQRTSRVELAANDNSSRSMSAVVFLPHALPCFEVVDSCIKQYMTVLIGHEKRKEQRNENDTAATVALLLVEKNLLERNCRCFGYMFLSLRAASRSGLNIRGEIIKSLRKLDKASEGFAERGSRPLFL